MFSTTLLISVFSFFLNGTPTECQSAYQDATYGYQHLKKSLQTKYHDEMQLYAEKAKTSLTKVYTATQICTCTEASSASYDAIEYLEKALEKDTYEASRYFVGKAEQFTKTVITSLDSCDESNLTTQSDEAAENLEDEEEQLIAQQKQLEEQQRKLAEKLEKQKALREQLATERQAKKEKQQQIIGETENFLLIYNQLIDKFAATSNCTAPSLTLVTRSEAQLESETIKATQLYYANNIKQMTDDLITALESCDE